MTRIPLVSIAMPVRNCQATIGNAVRSILAQSCSDWELIVMDDGSTDGTMELVNGFHDARIKIISDGRWLRLSHRLNQCIELARGTYLARMDGDDLTYPERIEHQIAFLETNPAVDLVGTGMLVFGERGVPKGIRVPPVEHRDIVAAPWSGFPIAHPTYCGRLEWFRRNRYRTDAVRAEDQDLLLRSFRRSVFSNIPRILHGYREEHLALRDLLSGRAHYSKSLLRERAQVGSSLRIVQGVGMQAAKGLVDTLAIRTGLGSLLLRHRALPTSSVDRQVWTDVLRTIEGFT